MPADDHRIKARKVYIVALFLKIFFKFFKLVVTKTEDDLTSNNRLLILILMILY